MSDTQKGSNHTAKCKKLKSAISNWKFEKHVDENEHTDSKKTLDKYLALEYCICLLEGKGKLNYNSIDLDFILKFGKYEGKSIIQVVDVDPSYIKWCQDNVPYFDLSIDAFEYYSDKIEEQDDAKHHSVNKTNKSKHNDEEIYAPSNSKYNDPDYDDDYIDEVFEGDPSLKWNID